MFGAPGQGVASLLASIDAAVDAGADHVSLYALTVHPDTPFGRAGEEALGLPGEEETVAMYEGARAALRSAGLVHYEIANWARPGAECVHNLNTWVGGHYLGAGAGAHGHAPGVEGSTRYANVPDAGAYMAAVARGGAPTASSEPIDRAARGRELVYTGLRMMRGIDLAWLAGRASEGDADRVRAAAPRLVDDGMVHFDGRTIRLTERGELFADRVAVELI
jgi:oxygen-independent coproporphyrinogen-3 oxidase